jgi:hypothetical protein
MSDGAKATNSSNLGKIFYPVITLWVRDKTYLLFFIVINIVVGQTGLIASLLVTYQGGGSQIDAWMQNLSSAALFTFSISLVASSIALFGSEAIDAFRVKAEMRLFEQKISWTLIAIVVLILQALMVGPLLSTNPGSQSWSSASVIEISKKPDSGINSQSPSIQSMPPTGPTDFKSTTTRHTGQILFWLISMFVSLQLFCLSRIHLIPNMYAEKRNKDVREITEKADSQTKTSFDEKV